MEYEKLRPQFRTQVEAPEDGGEGAEPFPGTTHHISMGDFDQHNPAARMRRHYVEHLNWTQLQDKCFVRVCVCVYK